MSNREFFRPRSSLVMAGIVYLVLAIMMIQTLFVSSLHGILSTAAWSTFVASITYLVLHRPSIEIFDEGIVLTNPLLTHQFGWSDVEEIETKYAFSIESRGRTIYSFAAPAPGRYHARTVHETELRGMKIADTGTIRPGDSPRSHSGVAAYLARTRLENFRANGAQNACATNSRINRSGLTLMTLSACVGLLLSVYHF